MHTHAHPPRGVHRSANRSGMSILPKTQILEYAHATNFSTSHFPFQMIDGIDRMIQERKYSNYSMKDERFLNKSIDFYWNDNVHLTWKSLTEKSKSEKNPTTSGYSLREVHVRTMSRTNSSLSLLLASSRLEPLVLTSRGWIPDPSQKLPKDFFFWVRIWKHDHTIKSWIIYMHVFVRSRWS